MSIKSVLDDGEELLARMNEAGRRRRAVAAQKACDEVVVEVNLGMSPTGHRRVESKSIPRRKMRDLGFDV